TKTFNLPAHEGAVTISVQGFAKGDGYGRYCYIRLDGEQKIKKIVAGQFNWSQTLELPAGQHTLEVEVTSWVGYWEIYAQCNYMPTPGLDLPLIDLAEVDMTIPIVGAVIAVIGGVSYFLTDGFQKMPTLPEFKLPF
ncbi:MAG: hypothetical protein ACTSPB_25080, partial [Candidatus Thorarchaeota archaeon]